MPSLNDGTCLARPSCSPPSSCVIVSAERAARDSTLRRNRKMRHSRRPAWRSRGDNRSMETFNLFNGPTDVAPDGTEPPGYLARAARLGPKLGASRLGMSVYDLPPGQAICPYHLEWQDGEGLTGGAGTPILRTPEGERLLEPGEVVCFPAGPDGAHHVRNAGMEPARVAIFSTRNEFGIAEYPD